MIKKLYTIVTRDGFSYTAKRLLAFILARIPGTDCLGFRFYRSYTLGFSRSMLTYVLFAAPAARNDDTVAFETFIKPGHTVIDIGAHVGSMAIIAAALTGETGTVLAFEPSPKFAAILKRNVTRNHLTDTITIIPKAVGAKPAHTFINEAVADDTTNHIDTIGTPVEQTTLDDYTKELARVDFLKIDVEGYEYEVLSGAVNTLRKTAVIYIEFYSQNLKQAGCDPASIISLLQQNFTLYTQAVTSTKLIPFTFDPTVSYMVNLIALKRAE